MLVILAYVEYLLGKRIVANMQHLNFPTELLDPEDVVKLSPNLQGCTVCIDEIHTIADSRKSHSEQNIQIANFLLQSRHRGVNVIYTDQYEGQVEKRIRENTDIVIVARNLYDDSDHDGNWDQFEYVVMDLRIESQDVRQLYGAPFFSMYQDFEIINIYDRKADIAAEKQAKKDRKQKSKRKKRRHL